MHLYTNISYLEHGLRFYVNTEVAKWFDEANNIMKSTWIKACKEDCLKPS